MLNDVISVKVHILLDASRCIEQVRKTSFILNVDLWFSENHEYYPSVDKTNPQTAECVSSRQLLLHFDLCRGLHYNLPVIFDYFHLSSLTLSVHASLITICQPSVQLKHMSNSSRTSKEKKKIMSNDAFLGPESIGSVGYDVLLFGCSAESLKEKERNEVELRGRRAQLVHWQLVSIMFSAINSLDRKMTQYKSIAPIMSHLKLAIQSIEIKPNSRSMSFLAQTCYKNSALAKHNSSKNYCNNNSNINQATAFINQQLNYDKYLMEGQKNQQDKNYRNRHLQTPGHMTPAAYVSLVESDLAYLSGLNIILWRQFLTLVLHNERIADHLVQVHHFQRIKRFSEGFFLIEKSPSLMMSVCDPNSQIFTEISDGIRKSKYFQMLPSCDVECLSLDGDPLTLPIIFEERFMSCQNASVGRQQQIVDRQRFKSDPTVKSSSDHEYYNTVAKRYEMRFQQNLDPTGLRTASSASAPTASCEDLTRPTVSSTSGFVSEGTASATGFSFPSSTSFSGNNMIMDDLQSKNLDFDEIMMRVGGSDVQQQLLTDMRMKHKSKFSLKKTFSSPSRYENMKELSKSGLSKSTSSGLERRRSFHGAFSSSGVSSRSGRKKDDMKLDIQALKEFSSSGLSRKKQQMISEFKTSSTLSAPACDPEKSTSPLSLINFKFTETDMKDILEASPCVPFVTFALVGKKVIKPPKEFRDGDDDNSNSDDQKTPAADEEKKDHVVQVTHVEETADLKKDEKLMAESDTTIIPEEGKKEVNPTDPVVDLGCKETEKTEESGEKKKEKKKKRVTMADDLTQEIIIESSPKEEMDDFEWDFGDDDDPKVGEEDDNESPEEKNHQMKTAQEEDGDEEVFEPLISEDKESQPESDTKKKRIKSSGNEEAEEEEKIRDAEEDKDQFNGTPYFPKPPLGIQYDSQGSRTGDS